MVQDILRVDFVRTQVIRKPYHPISQSWFNEAQFDQAQFDEAQFDQARFAQDQTICKGRQDYESVFESQGL
jgi:hypothetical protein